MPRLLVVFLGIAFVAHALPARGHTPESAARKFLALAYDGRFDELPKTRDARTERFERQVRNVLRVRCIRADRVAITVIDQGTLDADVAITKRDPLGSGEWSSVEIVPLRLQLQRQGDAWLIAEIRNRDEDYAETLLQATSEERERLLREQPGRLSKGLARALYARTLAYLNSGKFKEASDAAAFARKVAIEAGDRGGEALALGVAIYSSPQSEMERLSQESLDIAATTGEPDVLARVWYDRGRRFQLAPRDRNARYTNDLLECYRNARRLAQRAEDPIILIRILYSLANFAASRQSDLLTGRRYIDEGMALAREVGDVPGEMAFEMVLATIYLAHEDRERGLFHLGRATELAEKTQAFAYPMLLIRRGCLLVDDGQFDEARRIFDQLLVRKETGIASRSRPISGDATASALRCMSVIEATAGNFGEAECLNREAASLNHDPAVSYLFDLAPQYASRGNHRGALAASLASLVHDELTIQQRANACIGAARAYRDLGMADRGLSLALEAMEIREAFDAKVAGDEQQRAIAARESSEAYELAAELSLERGEPLDALTFLERGRAGVLISILDNGRSGSAEIDAAVREQESAFDREVVRIRTELDRAQSADQKAIAELNERLNRARALRASFLDGVRARSERRDAARRRIDGAGILRVASKLPPRTIAVEYFITDHDLSIFVLGENGLSVRTKRVERKVLDERVRVFLERLANNDLRFEAPGRELYSLLMELIERDVAGADALLIVPDDSLWTVPFAALVDRRGKFMVESKAIFYAPSMTAWASIADARKRAKVPRGSLLAIANPTLDPAVSKIATSFYRTASLGSLPDAESEVDALRALYDPRHSLVLKRQDATEARTKVALRDAAVAHFATHAILDDANPMYSRLMLARDGHAEEDGWLESWEVARLEVDADLVVLAACDTARGRVGGGEGVVGLSWSFFLAGASSTVATQWKVVSDSTAGFMIAFHRFLRSRTASPALHKAQAVRAAQLRAIRDKRTSHPFHWAAFVLLGDPSVRVTED